MRSRDLRLFLKNFKIFEFFFSFIFSNWLILSRKKRKKYFCPLWGQVTWDLEFFSKLKKKDYFFVYFFDLTNLIYLFFQTQINGLIHIHTGSIMRCKRIPKHLWFLWSRNLQPSYFRMSLLVFLWRIISSIHQHQVLERTLILSESKNTKRIVHYEVRSPET